LAGASGRRRPAAGVGSVGVGIPGVEVHVEWSAGAAGGDAEWVR
jgi:hypothetical protein